MPSLNLLPGSCWEVTLGPWLVFELPAKVDFLQLSHRISFCCWFPSENSDSSNLTVFIFGPFAWVASIGVSRLESQLGVLLPSSRLASKFGLTIPRSLADLIFSSWIFFRRGLGSSSSPTGASLIIERFTLSSTWQVGSRKSCWTGHSSSVSGDSSPLKHVRLSDGSILVFLCNSVSGRVWSVRCDPEWKRLRLAEGITPNVRKFCKASFGRT